MKLLRFSIRRFLAGAFALVTGFLNLSFFSAIQFIPHDAIYWILPAVGPSLKLGLPYRDFWDEKSPGLLGFVKFWTVFFGDTNFSFKLFHLFSHLWVVFFFGLIIRRIDRSSARWLWFVLGCVFYFSPYLNNNFLSVEQLSFVFSMPALFFIVRYTDNKKWTDLLFGAFCLFFSGTVKDPFFLTSACLIPVLFSSLLALNWRRLSKETGLLLCAFFIVFGLMFLYLMYYGIVNEFWEVQQFKSGKFSPVERILSSWQFFRFGPIFMGRIFVFGAVLFWLTLIFALCLVSLGWFKHRLAQKPIICGFVPCCVVLLYYFGIFFGVYLQGKTHSGHYLHTMILPFFLMLSALARLLDGLFAKKGALFAFAASALVFCIPNRDALSVYAKSNLNVPQVMHELVKRPDEPNMFSRIRERTNPDDYVLSLYGWSSGTTYFYARRKPVARFMTIHDSMFAPYHIVEYVRRFVTRVPKAIRYQTEGADMNVPRFEEATLRIQNILSDFYEQDKDFPELYFLKAQPEQVSYMMQSGNPERYLGSRFNDFLRRLTTKPSASK